MAAGAVGQPGMVKFVGIPIYNIGVAAHAGPRVMCFRGCLQVAGFAVQDVAVVKRDCLPVLGISVAAHTLTGVVR